YPSRQSRDYCRKPNRRARMGFREKQGEQCRRLHARATGIPARNWGIEIRGQRQIDKRVFDRQQGQIRVRQQAGTSSPCFGEWGWGALLEDAILTPTSAQPIPNHLR